MIIPLYDLNQTRRVRIILVQCIEPTLFERAEFSVELVNHAAVSDTTPCTPVWDQAKINQQLLSSLSWSCPALLCSFSLFAQRNQAVMNVDPWRKSAHTFRLGHNISCFYIIYKLIFCKFSDFYNVLMYYFFCDKVLSMGQIGWNNPAGGVLSRGVGFRSDLHGAADKSFLHHIYDLISVSWLIFLGLMGWNLLSQAPRLYGIIIPHTHLGCNWKIEYDARMKPYVLVSVFIEPWHYMIYIY